MAQTQLLRPRPSLARACCLRCHEQRNRLQPNLSSLVVQVAAIERDVVPRIAELTEQSAEIIKACAGDAAPSCRRRRRSTGPRQRRARPTEQCRPSVHDHEPRLCRAKRRNRLLRRML